MNDYWSGWYIDDFEASDLRAATGQMTCAPQNVLCDSTNVYMFTYKAEYNMSGGLVQIDIPRLPDGLRRKSQIPTISDSSKPCLPRAAPSSAGLQTLPVTASSYTSRT